MATLITLVDGTIPVASDFNTNFTNLNTELRPVTTGGTGAATLTANGVVLGNGTSAVSVTAAGSADQVLRVPSAGGAPAFGALDLTKSGTVGTSILPTANGGTGIAYFTAAGPTAARIYTFPDAACSILTTNAAVTVAQGGTGITSGTSGGIPYFSGTGTLASSGLLTAKSLLLGGGAGATPTALGAATNGQIPIGSTGANPVLATITAGTNITVTNAAGSITIASTAVDQFTSEVTS